jgi:histone deacetylase 6
MEVLHSAEYIRKVGGAFTKGAKVRARNVNGRYLKVTEDIYLNAHTATANDEKPLRITALSARFVLEKLVQRLQALQSRAATDEELLRCHSAEHIERVDNGFEALLASVDPGGVGRNATGVYVVRDADIYFNRHTATAARFAAGCCTVAVETVVAGLVQSALAVVRPPGHHAVCDRAMGFCYHNNTVVAALAALAAGLVRVVIVEWDVHHGNGIQDALYDRDDVLVISLHRRRAVKGVGPGCFYPWTTGHANEVGAGKGKGRNVNIPWPSGMVNDADYLVRALARCRAALPRRAAAARARAAFELAP